MINYNIHPEYQKAIIDNCISGGEWEQVRYDVQALFMYSIDMLNYIDQIPISNSVIDIGCSYGTLLGYLHTQGWKRCVGVDIDNLCNQSFLDKHNIEFIQCDIEREEILIPENTFDLVVFTEVLEHLGYDPIKALNSVRWLLSSTGKLLLSTPTNEINKVWSAGLLQGNPPYEYPGRDLPPGDIDTHYYIYNKNELVNILRGVGFIVEFVEIKGDHIYIIARK